MSFNNFIDIFLGNLIFFISFTSNLNKYFAGELTSEEKEVFLLNVKNNGEMREEFIEYQSVVALVDWSFPKDDKELAKQKLSEFMSRIENSENKKA